MRRIISALLVIILLLSFAAYALGPDDYDAAEPALLKQDELYAESAILIDGKSGNILFAKNEHQRMHPASTTKVMTLLLGIESGIDLDSVIAVPQAAADVPNDSTLIPVYPGDQLTFKDLLTSFFLCSGNDGANAIAVLVSGSIDDFVMLMNRRAAEIGCEDTHFANAHGYTDDTHYTTAYDLALITKTAMDNATFREIARKTTITFNVLNRGTLTVSNKHYIMRPDSPFYYADCIGVKTGSTNAAGKCYVGAAQRNNASIISVVMKCEEEDQRWIDTTRLFNYGWTEYDSYTLPQMFVTAEADIAKVTISNADIDDPFDGELTLSLAQISQSDYLQMVERNNTAALSVIANEFVENSTLEITHPLTAPITEGEVMGNFVYVNPQTHNMVTAVLVASRSVKERPVYMVITDVFPFLKVFGNKLFPVLVGFVVLLIVLIIALVASRRAAKQRRRKRILEQKRREYIRREQMKRRAAAQNRSASAQHGRAPQSRGMSSESAQSAARRAEQIRRRESDIRRKR